MEGMAGEFLLRRNFLRFKCLLQVMFRLTVFLHLAASVHLSSPVARTEQWKPHPY